MKGKIVWTGIRVTEEERAFAVSRLFPEAGVVSPYDATVSLIKKYGAPEYALLDLKTGEFVVEDHVAKARATRRAKKQTREMFE